jgi:hypothetical protein
MGSCDEGLQTVSKEITMLKAALVATSALVAVVFTATVTGSAAHAGTKNCVHRVNPYVLCTDKIKAKTNQTRAVRTTPLWSARARNRF